MGVSHLDNWHLSGWDCCSGRQEGENKKRDDDDSYAWVQIPTIKPSQEREKETKKKETSHFFSWNKISSCIISSINIMVLNMSTIQNIKSWEKKSQDSGGSSTAGHQVPRIKGTSSSWKWSSCQCRILRLEPCHFAYKHTEMHKSGTEMILLELGACCHQLVEFLFYSECLSDHLSECCHSLFYFDINN